MFVWHHSSDSKFSGAEDKNLQLNSRPSQGQKFFFQAIIYFPIFSAIIFGVGACLVQTIWLSKMAATRSNLGFFGNEFRNENLHFRDKLWWVTNLSARFLLLLTKDIRFFGLTFSFKVFRPGKVQLFFCHSQDRSKRFYAGRTKKNRENFDWIITARLSFHHQTSFFTTSMDFRCLPGAKQISTAENRHGQIKWNTTTWTVIDCATPPLHVLYFRSFRAHRALTFYMYKTVHAQHDVKGRWLWCTWKSTENGVSDDSLNKVTFLVDQTSTL